MTELMLKSPYIFDKTLAFSYDNIAKQHNVD